VSAVCQVTDERYPGGKVWGGELRLRPVDSVIVASERPAPRPCVRESRRPSALVGDISSRSPGRDSCGTALRRSPQPSLAVGPGERSSTAPALEGCVEDQIITSDVPPNRRPARHHCTGFRQDSGSWTVG